jgi:ABC transporter C-terminal domain
MASPSFYTTRGDEVAPTRQRLAAIEDELLQVYARWMELESLAGGAEE